MDEVIRALTILTSSDINQDEYNKISSDAEKWFSKMENLKPSIELLENSSLSNDVKYLILLHFLPNLTKLYSEIVKEPEDIYGEILNHFFQLLSVFQENEQMLILILQVISYITLNNLNSFNDVQKILDQNEQLKYIFFYLFMEQMNIDNYNHKKVEVCAFMSMPEHHQMFIEYAANYADDPNKFLRYCSFLVSAPMGFTGLEFLNPYLEKIIEHLLNMENFSASYAFLESVFSPLIDESIDINFVTNICENLLPIFKENISNPDYTSQILDIWQIFLSFDQVDELYESYPKFIDDLSDEFFEQIQSIEELPEGFSLNLDCFSSFFSQLYSIEDQGKEKGKHIEVADRFLTHCLEYINFGSEDSISIYMQDAIQDMLDNRSNKIGVESTEEILQTLEDYPNLYLFISAVSHECIDEACDLLVQCQEIPNTIFVFLENLYDKISTNLEEILNIVIQIYPNNTLTCSKVIHYFSIHHMEVVESHIQEIFDLLSQTEDFHSFSNIIFSVLYILNEQDASLSLPPDFSENIISVICNNDEHMHIINYLFENLSPKKEEIQSLFQQICAIVMSNIQGIFQQLGIQGEKTNEIEEEYCKFFSLSIQNKYTEDVSFPLEYYLTLLQTKTKFERFLLDRIYLVFMETPQIIQNETFLSYFHSINMEQKPEETANLIEFIQYIVKKVPELREHIFDYFPYEFIMNYFHSNNPAIQNRLLDLICLLVPFLEQNQRGEILTIIIQLLQTSYKKTQAQFACNVFLTIREFEGGDFVAQIFHDGGESAYTDEICEILASSDEIDNSHLKSLFEKYNSSFNPQSRKLN